MKKFDHTKTNLYFYEKPASAAKVITWLMKDGFHVDDKNAESIRNSVEKYNRG